MDLNRKIDLDRPGHMAALSCLLLTAVTLGGCSAYGDPLFCTTAMSFVPAKHAAQPPPPPLCYRAEPMYYGYHGTCWRPWPEGWSPCAGSCLLPPQELPPSNGEMPAAPGNVNGEEVPPGVPREEPLPQEPNPSAMEPPSDLPPQPTAPTDSRQNLAPPASEREVQPEPSNTGNAVTPPPEESAARAPHGKPTPPSAAVRPPLPEGADSPPDSDAVLNGTFRDPFQRPDTSGGKTPSVGAATAEEAVRVSPRHEKSALQRAGFLAEVADDMPRAEGSGKKVRMLRLYP